MNENLLFDETYNSLKEENEELYALNKSIFFSPELYLAFRFGKAISNNQKEIFNSDVEWKREKKLSKEGLSDIVFETKTELFVFEIKVRDTYHSYEKDIIKLSNIKFYKNKKVSKYFIALIDSWSDGENQDPRIGYLNNRENLNLINLKSIPTIKYDYNKEIVCSFGIWKINL